MLASGADVAIGSNQFMLAADAEEPYIYIAENLFPTTAEVAGTDKKTANQNILLWSYDNFIGGDGLKYYDGDQPARWHTGNNNPRAFPGSIQGTPTRTQSTDITTGATPTHGHFVAAQGRLWYLTQDMGFYSTDAATWTQNTDIDTEITADLGADGQIKAACSDGDYVYFAANDATDQSVWRIDSTSAATSVINQYLHSSVISGGGPILGMAVLDGWLYGWTGTYLLRVPIYDSTAFPITVSIDDNRVAILGDNAQGTQYAGMINAGESLVYFRSYEGQSVLFETKVDPQTGKLGHRTFWTMVDGFTAKHIAYSAGVLYVVGDYQGKIGLWGYSMVQRQPLFLGYVGESVSATNVRWMAASYGAQVTIGVDDGTTNFIYVYDAEEDAFSQLDEVTIASVGTMTAGATYRQRRVMAAFSTTTTKINRWVLDSDTPTGTWDWDSAAHDFDYPQDEKVLLGFHVIQDPSFASGTVNVDYQLDEDGSWIDAGTTSAGAKHTYIQVSDGTTTRKFRTLRVRMTGTNGVRVFNITARAYVNTKQEVWRLVLDLRNEPGTLRRPSSRASRAATLRNYLRTLVTTGSVVTFKDGRRYPEKSDTLDVGYSSHTCLIEFPKDSIDSATEGRCEVILRSVAPSA